MSEGSYSGVGFRRRPPHEEIEEQTQKAGALLHRGRGQALDEREIPVTDFERIKTCEVSVATYD